MAITGEGLLYGCLLLGCLASLVAAIVLRMEKRPIWHALWAFPASLLFFVFLLVWGHLEQLFRS